MFVVNYGGRGSQVIILTSVFANYETSKLSLLGSGYCEEGSVLNICVVAPARTMIIDSEGMSLALISVLIAAKLY